MATKAPAQRGRSGSISVANLEAAGVPVTAAPLLSTTERVMKDVTPPASEPLSRDKLFTPDGRYNCENLKEHFTREGRLSITDATTLVRKAAEALKNEPNLLRVTDQLTVVGDLHGQFFDLLKVFELGGAPGLNSQYLFLGDYVDRGVFSTEICLYLFALKLTYPNNFHLLRGNHECRHLTAYFNFKEECRKKYNLELYEELMDAFDTLPLAAVLNNKFLCMHGGLSPDVKTLADIENIYRFMEPPLSGPMCDLLWSDPMSDGYEDYSADEFMVNHVRGCSYFFSYNAVQRFLESNHLLSVIRAHEAQFEGYQMLKKIESTEFPSVITVFSAPNYCGTYGNKGAVLRFQNNLLNIRQFSCSPAPYWLPNFMNVFQWSLPFIAEKTTELLSSIMSLQDPDEEEAEEEKQAAAPPALGERAGLFKKKVVAMSKLLRMLRTLRTENETIQILKTFYDGQKLPVGLLSAGATALRVEYNQFAKEKSKNQLEEARPPGLPPARRSAHDLPSLGKK
eukprot:gnl/Hemi2/21801_TR7275_c0_g1_i1.p1 gnl/Hemi2/21801_TR7275_c0_g1~~gnl/Hemi2/21801_TR7275_c0_g1_i1.p1  ORF type:complete len:510 (-),score=155.90 gnl/Hemi2/21801_TR7275_c0_g1_i1:399-1928(-)